MIKYAAVTVASWLGVAVRQRRSVVKCPSVGGCRIELVSFRMKDCDSAGMAAVGDFLLQCPRSTANSERLVATGLTLSTP